MWKPIHEAHAIERVRLQAFFTDALPEKALGAATEEARARAEEFGFDSIERVVSKEGEMTLVFGPGGRPKIMNEDGLVFRRHEGSEGVEEAGFRLGRFGYLTTSYGRWETVFTRVSDIFAPAFAKISNVVGIESLRIEYWDAFIYEGDKDHGDPAELLNIDMEAVPVGSRAPGSLWHLHAGWFEERGGETFLVHRNIDVVRRKLPDGEERLFLTVHTMVERRNEDGEIGDGRVFDLFGKMHAVSNTLFGGLLRAEIRERIGLNIEEYQ